jgi:Uma2 family endonuclease
MVLPPSPRHRWTRTEFYKIVEAGCFRPDAHLELIEGDIIEKELPMNTPHATGVRRGENILRAIFSSEYVVSAQLPLTLSETDEPLPDLAVTAGASGDFEEAHPTTAVLIIEVLDTTLRYDRMTKA